SNVPLIAGIAGGAVVLLILIGVIIWCCIRKSKTKESDGYEFETKARYQNVDQNKYGRNEGHGGKGGYGGAASDRRRYEEEDDRRAPRRGDTQTRPYAGGPPRGQSATRGGDRGGEYAPRREPSQGRGGRDPRDNRQPQGGRDRSAARGDRLKIYQNDITSFKEDILELQLGFQKKFSTQPAQDCAIVSAAFKLSLGPSCCGTPPAGCDASGRVTEIDAGCIQRPQWFGSTFPQGLEALPNLRIMFFDNCEMTGPLPDTFGGFSQLFEMHLQGNHFNGPIPPSFAGMITGLSSWTILQAGEFQGNCLTGSSP
ncbi:hypothetical protein HDU99_005642, partial [Rhizoclosmatium hyalinum]